MKRALPIGLTFLAACGPDLGDAPDLEAPCDRLSVERLEHAVLPPANVATLVRVTDCRRQPLREQLDSRNFSLFEDNAPLSAYEADRVVQPAERQTTHRTAILLDMSGSVLRAGRRPAMVEGAGELIDALGADHEIALYGFDGRPDLIRFHGFSADKRALHHALQDVLEATIVDDSTNLRGAVLNGLQVLDQTVSAANLDYYSIAQGALVVFTDGTDRAGRVTREELDDALSATAHATFAIGIGDELRTDHLEEIGRTRAVLAGSDREIVEAFEEVGSVLLERAKAHYLVSYCSPARAGRHSLEIRVEHDGLRGAVQLWFDATGFGAGCAPTDAPLR